jgi:hypothetical protein
MSTDVSDDLPVTEMVAIQEVTCMECSRVECIGPLTRLTFTIPARIDPPPAKQYRVVVAKLLVPTEMVPAIATQMTSTQKWLPPSGDEATLQ